MSPDFAPHRSEPITVWVELAEPEVVSAFKLQCGIVGLATQGLLHAIFPIIVTLAFCLFKFDAIFQDADLAMVGLLTLSIVIDIAAFALGVFKRIGYVEYQYIAHRFYREPIIYAIGREGLVVSSCQGDNAIGWQALLSAFETPEMVVLVTVRKTVLPIPKRCFADEREQSAVISHLRATLPNYALLAGQKSPMRVSPRG